MGCAFWLRFGLEMGSLLPFGCLLVLVQFLEGFSST